jgi:hypothetical protein
MSVPRLTINTELNLLANKHFSEALAARKASAETDEAEFQVSLVDFIKPFIIN